MSILSKDRISLQASAIDKADAIRKAGELLGQIRLCIA